MENFKDLLTITPITYTEKNVVKIDIVWDYGEGDRDANDYHEYNEKLNANEFFRDKKLIYLLAYLNGHYAYVDDNDYIDFDALIEAADNLHYWFLDVGVEGYPDDINVLNSLKITYYDNNSNPFNITFDDIYKRWENMSDEGVWKEVNEVLKSNEDED